MSDEINKTETSSKPDRGHGAENPRQIPGKGWKAITKRVGHQMQADHVQIVSAGVAFYFFLALFPALAAAISIYGLVVDPSTAQQQIASTAAALPEETHQLISDQAQRLAGKSGSALGWGVALSILISLWSANKGTKGLFQGLNIAYDEDESRNFFMKNLITLGVTLVAILTGLLAITVIAGFPAVAGSFGLPAWALAVISWGRWLVLAVLLTVFLAFVYKVGPHRDSPRWKWVSPGSIFATIVWLLGSWGFSWFVSNFGKFGATYGSFAAVVILLLWLFLTAFVILVGAEINSESEHQTRKDTTVGEPDPMGERGAYHADHVAHGST